MKSNNHKFYTMVFSTVYPLYIAKVERKGRTQAEVDEVIFWLTGYDAAGLKNQIDQKSSFEQFFAQVPKLNPHASKITGMICGYRIQDIQDDLVKKVRYLDKLVDELAKGKSMDTILRT